MGTLDIRTEWNDLRMVNALEPRFAEALRRVYDYVTPVLATRPLGAEEYTDHDVQHSARVLERVAQILPAGTELNQPELYILSMAALLHDAGLWSSREEVVGLLENPEFRKYLGKTAEEELTRIQGLLADERLRWMGELSLQRLVAGYHRSRHPERLCTVVLDPEKEPGKTLRILIGDEYVEAVAAVSVAHSWTRERVLEADELRPMQFGNDPACLRFIACALRLGDLLDLGDGRVSELLWSYLAPMNAVSEAHWRKERTLKLERCSPEQIRVSGRFDVDQHGMAAAEAHRLAQDWLEMLRQEIEGVALVLNSRLEPEFRPRLQFGAMSLDIDRVMVNGLVLGGKVTFELPQKRVIELLSDEIYADRSVFIRELLQNAVDATRSQLVRDKRAGRFGGESELPEAEPWNWPHRVTSDERYQIELNLSGVDGGSDSHVEFSVIDRGIGMSLANLRDHFLQVGKSYYTTNLYRQEFSHSPISQFGIGFLTCLTVADRIEVTTRQHSEQSGLRLTLQKPSEHFIVEQDNSAAAGTTVRLKIAQSEIERLGLETFPQRETHFFSAPGEFTDALAIVVSQWAAYLEFPIVVNGVKIEPRDPSTFVPEYVVRDLPVESLPVKVVSEDEREIARGRIFYEVLEGTHLPTLHSVSPQTRTVASWRGIGLADGRIDFSNHQVLVALDYRRLPPRALAAGRSLRLNWTFFSFVGDRICQELQALATLELGKVGAETAALWKLFLDRRIAPRPPAPDTLPIRTRNGVGWKTWEQIRGEHSRVLLTPYHVAWRGPWSSELPAVGLTNEQLGSLRESNQDSVCSAQPIQDCAVICVDDACSVYLWPPGAHLQSLKPFERKHTYTHIGLVKWTTDTIPRRLAEAIPIDERLVSEEDLLAYDRLGDPWRRFGVHQYSRIDDGSVTGKSAAELFRSNQSWSLEGREIKIRIKEAENWQ